MYPKVEMLLVRELHHHVMNSIRKNETCHKPIVRIERFKYVLGTFWYVLNEILGKEKLNLYSLKYYEDIATFGGVECHSVT